MKRIHQQLAHISDPPFDSYPQQINKWLLVYTDREICAYFFYIYLCVYSTTFMPKKPPFYGYDFLDVYSGMLKKAIAAAAVA